MHTKTKTQSLAEFVDHPERRIESIYIRSRAIPNGRLYVEHWDHKGGDHCDCMELLCAYNLSPTDLLALDGRVRDDCWEWDGRGKVKDYAGHPIYELIATRTKEPLL